MKKLKFKNEEDVTATILPVGFYDKETMFPDQKARKFEEGEEFFADLPPQQGQVMLDPVDRDKEPIFLSASNVGRYFEDAS